MKKTAIFVSFFEPFSVDKQIEICTKFSNEHNFHTTICYSFNDLLNDKYDNIVMLSYLCLGDKAVNIHEKLDLLKNKIPNVYLYSIFEESCHDSISNIYGDSPENLIYMQIVFAIKTKNDFIKWTNFLK